MRCKTPIVAGVTRRREGVVGLPVLELGVHRMKQLDGDHDQRLLGRFALGFLAEINGAPLATTAYGIDGGEVERMARNARAHGRQAGSRRAALGFAGLPRPSYNRS